MQNRARAALEQRDAEADARRSELGVSDEIAELEALTPQMLVALGEAGVKSLDDLAEFAGFELIDPEDGPLRTFDLNEDEANDIIMAARAHWYEDDPVVPDEGEAVPESEDTANAGESEDSPNAG